MVFTTLQRRNMLRLTAKATQFGRRTFTSWLIESAGTVPLKRRKDYADGNADNTGAMEYLIQVCTSHSYYIHLTLSPFAYFLLDRHSNWEMLYAYFQKE